MRYIFRHSTPRFILIFIRALYDPTVRDRL
jgi:hypothetical protein